MAESFPDPYDPFAIKAWPSVSVETTAVAASPAGSKMGPPFGAVPSRGPSTLYSAGRPERILPTTVTSKDEVVAEKVVGRLAEAAVTREAKARATPRMRVLYLIFYINNR